MTAPTPDALAAGVHVLPLRDIAEHAEAQDCICGPRVEWIDPETGLAYPSGPVVIHSSLDGREAKEPKP